MPDSDSKLAQDRPESDGAQPSAQVLRFRPREGARDRPLAGPPPSAGEPDENELLDDLAQYEEDDSVNSPRRMLMNVIAVVVIVVLVGVGVWLADTIAEMQMNQDCVLQGRQNCAPIEVPVPIQQ
jgi:hypothetical protein